MLKFADLSKGSARFGRFRPNYCHFARVVRVVRVKTASHFGHCRRAPTDVITPSSTATHCPSPRRLLEPTCRRRARAEPRARRSLVAHRRPCRARAAPRAPVWPHRRAPTGVIAPSSVATLPAAAPAPPSHTTTARASRAARTSFLDRAPPTLSSVRRSCCRAPRALDDTTTLLSFCCSPRHRSPRLLNLDLGRRLRRRASAAPRACRRSDRTPLFNRARADRRGLRFPGLALSHPTR